MKRSQINRILQEARGTLHDFNITLPPWAFRSPKDWQDVGPEANQIRKHELGWICTDFGYGEFEEHGLVIFVSRNGCLGPDGNLVSPKCYAEKVMIVRPGQVTPFHFHWQKFEDLVNRGQHGRLQVQLAWAHENERDLMDGDVEITQDGHTRTVKAKEIITLGPGESVELPPRLCHQFFGHPLDGQILAGEISVTNNDHTDNCFLGVDVGGKGIEEDEEPTILLASDYAQYWPERK